jgi:hypothetical protein
MVNASDVYCEDLDTSLPAELARTRAELADLREQVRSLQHVTIPEEADL